MSKIALDSIVASVPPTYKLNYLLLHGQERVTPTTPIQMAIDGYGRVNFKFWGADNYDVHIAFPRIADEIIGDDGIKVIAINYRIIVIAHPETPSIAADYEHRFKCNPVLGFKGLVCRTPMFKFYRALEHLPKLPHDWQYIQFIG